MSQDFKRLSEVVANAREAKGWTKLELAYECRLSASTIYMLEDGRREMTQQTHTRVERALGWTPGSVTAVLQGGTPTIDTGENRPGVDEIGRAHV